MRDHLGQAGVRPNATETQLRAGMNAGVYVRFTLGKEMMPDNFNGTDRVKFSDWEFKMSNFLSIGDYEDVGGTTCPRTGSMRSHCSGDGSDKQETSRGLRGICSRCWAIVQTECHIDC